MPVATAGRTDVPVVVRLHGTGDSAENFLRAWLPHLERLGYRAIAIQSPNPSGTYPWQVEEKGAAMAALDVFKASHGYDENLLFMAGFSAGAWGTCRYFLSEGDRFAAVAGTGGGVYRGGFHKPGAEKTAVFLQVGEADQFFSSVEKAEQGFRGAGFEVRYDTHPGVGHHYPPEGHRTVMEFFQLQAARRLAAGAKGRIQAAMRAR